MAKAGTSKKAAAARRRAFVEAYIANGSNATEAAITAGLSKKTAKQSGYMMLKEPEVAAAIEARRAELQQISGLTTERVLKELARLAFADVRKFYREDGSLKDVHELDDDAAAVLASVEVDEIGTDGVVIGHTRKLKAWDKNSALEKAMKHLGLFERDNKQSQPVTILATPQDERL